MTAKAHVCRMRMRVRSHGTSNKPMHVPSGDDEAEPDAQEEKH